MGWWRDRDELVRMLEAHGWNAASAAAATGVHRSTVSGWMKRHGLKAGAHGPRTAPIEQTSVGSDVRDGQVATELSPGDRADHQKLIDLAGYDEGAAEVAQVTVNRWDAPAEGGGTVAMAQVKAVVRPIVRVEDVLPPRDPGYVPPRVQQPSKAGTWYTYVTTDLHAPYHDEAKHAAQVRLLAKLKPAEAVDLGDMLDAPRPSRHRATPGWDASPNECIQSAYRVWADRVAASPGTRWRALLGNHDVRLEVAIRERVADLVNLKRANGDVPVYDIGYLLRFDELGVELVRPNGEYHAARVQLADGLFGQHGTATAPKGSTGAAKAGDLLTCSLLQGHDHRQGITYMTRLDEFGRPVTTTHVAVGASVRIEGGVGYAAQTNWQNGDAIVVHHEDGTWSVELVVWDGTALRWRDWRVEPC